MKTTFSNSLLKAGGGKFIPKKKATPLSKGEAQERVLSSAYKNAKESGKLGLGFGGPKAAALKKKMK